MKIERKDVELGSTWDSNFDLKITDLPPPPSSPHLASRRHWILVYTVGTEKALKHHLSYEREREREGGRETKTVEKKQK